MNKLILVLLAVSLFACGAPGGSQNVGTLIVVDQGPGHFTIWLDVNEGAVSVNNATLLMEEKAQQLCLSDGYSYASLDNWDNRNNILSAQVYCSP